MDSVIELYTSVAPSGFLRRWVHEMRGAGFIVEEIYSIEASTIRNSVGLRRLWNRYRMLFGFAFTATKRVYSRSGSERIRIVTTNPFYAPSLIARLTKEKGKVVNLVYDLYPDALENAGFVRKNSMIGRRLEAITRYAFTECHVSVFLGERIQRHAERRYGAARRSIVIPVGADGSGFRTVMPKPSSSIRILYSGQMGWMHEIETIMHLAKIGWNSSCQLHIRASGAGYQRLLRECRPYEKVVIKGPLEDEPWRALMAEAHVALITISPGAENIIMPSKTYSALAAGQAIIAVCDIESDLADLVLGGKCGWVVSPGDVFGLREVFEEIEADPQGLDLKQRNAFVLGHSQYEMATVVKKSWLPLIDSLMH